LLVLAGIGMAVIMRLKRLDPVADRAGFEIRFGRPVLTGTTTARPGKV